MPKRKAKKAHQVCDICECRLPDGDESWRVHVEGIRHRRRCAQVKNRGQLQLSIFEDLPQHGASTFCRDPVVQELQRRQQRRRLVVGSDGMDLDKLHRSMMLDLPHLCGLSTAYHLAASRLTSDAIQGEMATAEQLLSSCALQEGCEQLQDRCKVTERRTLQAPWYQRDELAILQMLGEDVPEEGPAPEAVPPAGAAGPVQEDRDWLVLPRLSPAAVAAVAAALPRSCTEVLTLRLALPCDTASQAAAAASLCAVARALPSAPNLQRLQIRMETSMVELSQQIALSQPRAAKDEWGVLLRERSHIWAFFMATLCSSLQFNTTLTDLTICCLHGLLRAEDVAAVQSQMVAAPVRIRTAVLMACHRRLGAGSPLQLLPEGVLENILDRAAPRSGARLHLRAQELFPG